MGKNVQYEQFFPILVVYSHYALELTMKVKLSFVLILSCIPRKEPDLVGRNQLSINLIERLWR